MTPSISALWLQFHAGYSSHFPAHEGPWLSWLLLRRVVSIFRSLCFPSEWRSTAHGEVWGCVLCITFLEGENPNRVAFSEQSPRTVWWISDINPIDGVVLALKREQRLKLVTGCVPWEGEKLCSKRMGFFHFGNWMMELHSCHVYGGKDVKTPKLIHLEVKQPFSQ